jgi:hemolysin TlyA family protein
MMKKLRQRLDQLVMNRMPQYSRQQIQSWIMQGKVKVNDVIVNKPGAPVAPDAILDLSIEQPKFVGRAGFKLEKALEDFGIVVKDLVALDAGISTGGFTDCLLQNGIKKVYGVDVGYGQVHEHVSSNPKVEIMERTNLRNLETVGELVDIVTLDLSFISVLKVMDAVCRLLKDKGQLVVLIKPQFEAEKKQVVRGGIVKDATVHQQVIDRVTEGIKAHGFDCIGVTESPILGGDGNKEFLAYFKRQ